MHLGALNGWDNLPEGLPRREGLSQRASAGQIGESASARGPRRGELENRPRPRRCPSALIFVRSKQSFRFLLRVPLFMVSDSSPRASGGVRALSLRFDETWLAAAPVGIAFRTCGSGGCARAHPAGVAPEALEEWIYFSRGFFVIE